METERLNLKILRSDKSALRRLAAIEGESMSVVVRRIIRNELEQRGLLQPNDESEEENSTPSDSAA
jgi:uncharacterized protein (DUF1778 family)